MAIRQYRIITKTPTTDQVMLEPITHSALYNIPEVRTAVEFVEANKNVEMIGIRIDARFYSIVVVYDDELKDGHFQLKDFDVAVGDDG
jgi:hypothetical protein